LKAKKKMEQIMETLKTMLANNQEMKEKMGTNQAKADKTLKETLAKMEAERKSDLEHLKSMMERMTNVNQAKTDAKLKELTETIEKTQMELQTAEVSLDVRTRKLQEDLTETFNKTCAAIEETKHELQAQLEAVETRTEGGNTLTASTSTAPPPTFNRNTTWSVFRRQFEIVAEHNRWSDREKLTYLITALKGRAADVLYGIPTSTTYEETLQALEDCFGDHHFSAAYRCQLTTRTQKAGESLQDFATAIEQLAHRAYPILPEDHIRRKAGRVFAYGVKDPDT
jgi:DNA gyrase/topoisomerase IV subunit A